MRRETARPPRSVRAPTRAHWRRWLQKNHAGAEPVMLVYARKDSGRRSVTYLESVDEALCFGWIDGVRNRLDDVHFTVRFTPRRPGSGWSKRNLERVKLLIADGLMHEAGLKAHEQGRKAGAHDRAYAVRDKVRMPTELSRALVKNTAARKAFAGLSASQQNAWKRFIASGASLETRERRSRQTILLIRAGRKAGETDAQAARRGIPAKADILHGA